MTATQNINGIPDAALAYTAMGWPIIPLHGKVPALARWQQFQVTPDRCRSLFSPERSHNIGLRTGESDYICVDTDTREAEAWVGAHLPETPMRARSGNGSTHRFYQRPPRKEIRNKQAWHGIEGLDIRGHGGYLVLPPSIHPQTGRPYRWLTEILPPEQLPVFSPRWVYERPRLPTPAPMFRDKPDRTLRRIEAYVARIEPAISGQGGHNKTFYAACRIAELCDYDAMLTWSVLQIYNARCLPPWSERELRHKWKDALKRR